MIDFSCSCGAHFALPNEKLARRARCPKCGARAADILRLTPPELSTPPVAAATPEKKEPLPAPSEGSRIPSPPRVSPPAESPTSAAPAAASASTGQSKLRIRKSDEPPKPRPVSLPILERDLPPAQEDIPILMPIEDEPAAKTPPIAMPARIQPAAAKPLQPTGQKSKLSIAKEHGAAKAPATGAKATCANHPDQPATQNCMNCAKPICKECVKQNGYYCGHACKALVASREPQMARLKAKMAAERAGDDDGDSDSSSGRNILALLKVPLILLVVGGIGAGAYFLFFGPKGRVTGTMAVFSDMETFNARMVEPDLVIAQKDDELFAANVPTEQRLWTKDLRSLEEKFEPPKPKKKATAVPDSPGYAENLGGVSEGGEREYRDRLRLADAKAGHVIVVSTRQLLCFNAKDGSLEWQYYQTNSSVGIVAVHDSGILATIAPMWGATPGTKPRTVNFSFADGKEGWSLDSIGQTRRLVPWDGKLVWMGTEASATAAAASPAAAKPKPAKKKTVQVGDDEGGGGQEQAMDVSDYSDSSYTPPGANLVLKIIGGDGKPVSSKAIDIGADADLEIEGKRLFVLSGQQLMMFENGGDPVWKTKLADTPETLSSAGLGMGDDEDLGLLMFAASSSGSSRLSAPARRVVSGGDLVALKTANGVVALEAKSGQQKWTRSGLDARNLAVGPDGSVYASVDVEKATANQGEAAKYRLGVVAHGGFSFESKNMPALVKLDPKTGATRWGVKHIGRQLLFQDKDVLVVDTLEKMHIYSGEMFAGHIAVRSISPRSGRDRWLHMQKARIHHMESVGKQLFMVISDEAPAGRDNPKLNYKMQVIEKK